jgi:hypothetical protein
MSGVNSSSKNSLNGSRSSNRTFKKSPGLNNPSSLLVNPSRSSNRKSKKSTLRFFFFGSRSSNRKSKKKKSPGLNNPSSLLVNPSSPPKPATLRLKKTNRLPAINASKTQFDRFRQQFEELFAYMDKEQDYEVLDNMIKPYLDNEKNNLSSPKKVYSAAKKLFKSHRYLLYLDQFIAFVNEYSGKTKFLYKFTSNNYFNLPIASRVIPKLASVGNNHGNLAQEYAGEVYRELQPINDDARRTSRNMRDIQVINCHGSLSSLAVFLVVPDDVIIAFPTPLNKYFYSYLKTHNLFEILAPYRTNPEFLANPACYLRGDNCLMYTIYYYPGQLIPNFSFSYDTSDELENEENGYFPNNSYENMRDELFVEKYDSPKYYATNIFNLFLGEKKKLLKNKITYIMCCRKCDSEITNINIEFLYRYEHIITYLNISNCSEIESDRNNNLCPEATYAKISSKYNKLAENDSGHPYFYDSSLLSTFKIGNIHKDWYLNEKSEKYIKTIEELSKITSPTIQLEKFDEIFRSLIQKLKDNPELYAQRIIDLFEKVDVQFDLSSYILDHNILNVLTDYFIKYDQTKKLNLIFNFINKKFGLNIKLY